VWHYAQYRYNDADILGLVTLIVIMLYLVMLSSIMLSVIMLYLLMLSAIMLNVTFHFCHAECYYTDCCGTLILCMWDLLSMIGILVFKTGDLS
jgi:hypothetical protein